jgi:hypothetical protein
MKRIVIVLVCSVVVISTIGCRSLYRVEPIVSLEAGKHIEASRPAIFKWEGLRQRSLDIYSIKINPYKYGPFDDISYYNQAKFSSLDPERLAKAKVARNMLQNAMLHVSDEVTAQHLAGIKSTETVANLLFGAASLGLSGGATVAGEATARSLSAAATGTTGARALTNEQLYRNALVESLMAAIELDRSRFREEVIQRKQRASIIEYDVEAAIADANTYHQKASFYNGLTLIRQAVEERNLTNSAARRNAREHNINLMLDDSKEGLRHESQ